MIYFAMIDSIVWYDAWDSLDIVTNSHLFTAQESINKITLDKFNIIYYPIENLFDKILRSIVYNKYMYSFVLFYKK